MRQENHKASLFRIIQCDYIAALAVIFPIAIWVMYIVIAYLGWGYFPGLRGREPLTREAAPDIFYMAIISTVIFIPLLVWRIHSIQAMFARGVEVQGHITSIYFYRGRGRVEYTYTHQGQTYQRGNAITETRRTKALQSGDEVVLVIDRDNPKRVLIRDLYV